MDGQDCLKEEIPEKMSRTKLLSNVVENVVTMSYGFQRHRIFGDIRKCVTSSLKQDAIMMSILGAVSRERLGMSLGMSRVEVIRTRQHLRGPKKVEVAF